LIREHLIGALGLRPAIAAWTGASRTSQDFQLPRAAIEVKTTAGKQHQKLSIVSERQLDDAGLEVLLLLHLSLDVRQGAGESLVSLVGQVRDLVAQDPLSAEALESKLLAYGYVDAHSSRYEGTGYLVRQSNFFRVMAGFPRIVEKDLRSGVGDVSYSIQVSECMHHAVPASGALALVSKP
jgi:hypothetical protein